ncbi:MAG: carbon-nitrogen family hydrolase [Candidatus Margulisiibacteriota bacterium]
MKKRVISLLQMDIKTADPSHNLDRAAKLFEKAAQRRSEFICLPEMWSTGFAYDDLPAISKTWHKETIGFLTGWAKRSGAWVFGGSIPENDGGKVYNTSFVFDPSGKQIGAYRKIHIFSPTGEHEHFDHGRKMPVFEAGGAITASEICYDIRFPELSRKYWEKGAKLVFVPAQFPSKRVDHWLTLLKARAIENHCFMAGCNRIGRDRIYEYPGESVIYDPFGKIIEKASHREEVLTAQIDLSTVDEANKRIPIEKDRRPEVY